MKKQHCCQILSPGGDVLLLRPFLLLLPLLPLAQASPPSSDNSNISNSSNSSNNNNPYGFPTTFNPSMAILIGAFFFLGRFRFGVDPQRLEFLLHHLIRHASQLGVEDVDRGLKAPHLLSYPFHNVEAVAHHRLDRAPPAQDL